MHQVMASPWGKFFLVYAILAAAMIARRHAVRLVPLVLCMHPLGYLFADRQERSLQWGGAVFGFLALAWFLSGRWLAWAPPSERLPRWLGLFLAWLAVSLLVNRNWETGVPALAKLVLTMSAFVICRAEGIRLRQLLVPLSVTGAIIGLALVAQDVRGGAAGAPIGEAGHQRACVNMLANVEVIVVAAWLPFLSSLTGARRVAVQALILLATLAILAGASRQAALGLCLVMLLWALPRPDLHRRVAVLIGASVLFLVSGVSTFALSERFQDLLDHVSRPSVVDVSARSRTAALGMGLEMLRDHPLAGVGPGAYPDRSFSYAPPGLPDWRRLTAAPELKFSSPHCLYMLVADESGLPGLALLAGVFGGIAWRAARCFRSIPPTSEAMGILLALVPLYVSSLLADWQFNSPVLWGFLGLASVAFRTGAATPQSGSAGRVEGHAGEAGTPVAKAPDPVEVA